MSATTAQYAWANAERRIFNKLNEKVGLIEGISFFVADEIKGANDVTNLRLLSFEISGQQEVIQIAANQRPVASRAMAARLTGFFTERLIAQEICGIIEDIIPIDPGEIEGIQRFTKNGEPTLTRDVIPILDEAAVTQGGELQVWRLDWDFYCVFSNTERMQ
jgi:hypothetical protein